MNLMVIYEVKESFAIPIGFITQIHVHIETRKFIGSFGPKYQF